MGGMQSGVIHMLVHPSQMATGLVMSQVDVMSGAKSGLTSWMTAAHTAGSFPTAFSGAKTGI